MDLFDNGFLTYLVPLLNWLQQPGYPALFALSFLASTLVPLGSEWLLVLMLVRGYDPAVSVLTATTGNSLGACTTWLVGRYGGDWLLVRLFRISEQQRQRAEAWYQRYGILSLLFSWLPVAGDPLCLVGGLLKIRFTTFLLLVGVGKLVRYAAVAWLTVKMAA
ncbi:YqaA family protein [Trichlorobacter lovleyi]|uniref:SNARE associated Golgi protein n=1 Tax=Trichlorobacter lovleyi (strain ATCC BAA-1151 / DSM 17278 / SZ) TaxID=398767 RepID=B3E1L7_TRIL1|nr:YqaA family protein [Trichlorobacter lovleyi]ACD94109.1 SNARE associated Golgi protein [Trichlorobacter lovleyi SZ]